MTAEERRDLEILRLEVSGKLDLIIAGMGQLAKQSEDHEDRLRSMEKWKNAVPVAFLLAAASIIVALIRAG